MRAREWLVAIGLAAVWSAPAAGLGLYDDFEGQAGGEPLAPDKWNVGDSDGTAGDVTVDISDEGALTNWASFEFSGAAGNDDWARAWTDRTWSILDDGPLVWSMDFRVASGNDTTVLVPVLFDTDTSDGDVTDGFEEADVAVTVQFGTDTNAPSGTTLWVNGVGWAALRDDGDDLFEPLMANTFVHTLTLTLDDVNAYASLSGTYDGSSYGTYTASYAHGLADLSAAGYFGMRVDNFNGADAKVLQFDNARVIPEPVTMAGLVMGVGALATYLRRRRKRRPEGRRSDP